MHPHRIKSRQNLKQIARAAFIVQGTSICDGCGG